MRAADEESDNRTVFCGNLSDEVTDEILFELFNQAGPVESLRRPKDQAGRPKSFAFIVYKHECSVPYALELLRFDKLFNRNLNLNSRCTLQHYPVLDTHLSEFISCTVFDNFGSDNFKEYNHVKYQEHDHRHHRSRERDHRSEGKYTNERNHERHNSYHQTRFEEPNSWAEVNALKGRSSNSHHRIDLQSVHKREFEQPVMPDYEKMLQMGQQMMFPGMIGLPGMMSIIPPMGLGPSLGCNSMFPSMQGQINGGEHDRRRHHDVRDHPYNERRHSDHQNDYRQHERRSHHREYRDRRSYRK